MNEFEPIPTESWLLRIFLGEGDRHEGKPLYEAIVLRARELGMAGATVLRGPMGFGAHSRMHTARLLRLSEDLPIVIEMVDERPKIDRLLEEAGEMLSGGLVTLERVTVVRYRPHEDKAIED
jgi:hypothetical protein